MLTKRVGQLSTFDPASGEIEHETLLILYKRIDLTAVENQERLHGGVADALVAVHERVASNQREAQDRGLINQGWIQVDAAERGLGLGDGRLEGAQIAD